MTETFDKVVFGVVLLILIPVLLVPSGLIFALTVAVLWILVAYGTRYALDVEKERRSGERGRRAEIEARINDRGDR